MYPRKKGNQNYEDNLLAAVLERGNTPLGEDHSRLTRIQTETDRPTPKHSENTNMLTDFFLFTH